MIVVTKRGGVWLEVPKWLPSAHARGHVLSAPKSLSIPSPLLSLKVRERIRVRIGFGFTV